MENVTPMLRQYLDIKKLYPGTILFFRLGDFYEMFNEDAVLASRELEITLTARQKDSPNPIPMCGVPHHAASNYIARLVRRGYRVAICDQTEEAGKGVKLVKREVVRVITPGTAIDPQLVESKETVYLAAVCGRGDTYAAAFLELSAGQFSVTQSVSSDAWQKICDEVASFAPREIIFPTAMATEVSASLGAESDNSLFSDERSRPAGGSQFALTPVDDRDFDLSECERLLKEQFGVKELTGYGLSERNEAIRAAGACLKYARDTQRATAGHITDISYFESADSMILDAVTLRNLEIVDTRGENEKRTLFDVIDQNVTGMGSRLLRQWLLRPSLKRSEIQTRLAAVGELCDAIFRDKIRFLLKDVSDLERLIGRLNLGTASPRDLIALNRSISQAPKINETLSDARSLLLQVLAENIFELPEIRDLISRSISDEPPVNLNDGGVIRAGFNAELDELRSISTSAKQTIAGFEERERVRSGISTLKVRFNNVFGYYIEISKANLDRVPDDYERRQTLANAERYTTPQLKEWEQKVLGADDRIIKLEAELFQGIRAQVCSETRKLQSTARALATLDALAALAEAATRGNYTPPVIHDGDAIEIKNGRHPVVEHFNHLNFRAVGPGRRRDSQVRQRQRLDVH